MRKRKRPGGLIFFIVLYNCLGMIGVTAYVYGFSALTKNESLVIGQLDVTQMVGYSITVLLFATSYLLLIYKKIGMMLPILLLSFFIAGGFIILLPILVGHLIYFSTTPMKKRFRYWW